MNRERNIRIFFSVFLLIPFILLTLVFIKQAQIPVSIKGNHSATRLQNSAPFPESFLGVHDGPYHITTDYQIECVVGKIQALGVGQQEPGMDAKKFSIVLRFVQHGLCAVNRRYIMALKGHNNCEKARPSAHIQNFKFPFPASILEDQIRPSLTLKGA